MTAPAETHPLWLTTVLRPAGRMSAAGAAQFAAALDAAVASSEVVLVDLSSVGRLPRRARRALEAADADLTRAGGALVVVDPEGRQQLPAHLLGRLGLGPSGEARPGSMLG